MISKDALALKFRCSVSFVEKSIRRERDSPRAREILEYWETHTSEQMRLVNDRKFIELMEFVIEKSNKFEMIDRAHKLRGLAAEQIGVNYERRYPKKNSSKLKTKYS